MTWALDYFSVVTQLFKMAEVKDKADEVCKKTEEDYVREYLEPKFSLKSEIFWALIWILAFSLVISGIVIGFIGYEELFGVGIARKISITTEASNATAYSTSEDSTAY